ncbi:MAG: aldehyde ferredoxin oxidoreductase N-terminal domain-containing protein, partial [Anaerolineales bacterium]|nr:aldehyde ferredoxin oxidoreductase N-terminal domain-containing protein [Anaerolineales bacterium]
MALAGYEDCIGHVDLGAGSVEYKGVPEEWARKYIGGRGLGVRFVLENGPQVEALSPENIICFMLGPLSGTEINMSGRV